MEDVWQRAASIGLGAMHESDGRQSATFIGRCAVQQYEIRQCAMFIGLGAATRESGVK